MKTFWEITYDVLEYVEERKIEFIVLNGFIYLIFCLSFLDAKNGNPENYKADFARIGIHLASPK